MQKLSDHFVSYTKIINFVILPDEKTGYTEKYHSTIAQQLS